MTEMINESPAVVTIGGGTGSFTLLTAFKEHFDDLTAIVTMADNGGSTGVLRDELGVLPPGDIRQCLVALSEAPEMRDLFNFRHTEGSFKGHSFGNMFLSTVEKMSGGDFDTAVQMASDVLRIKGRVIPVTKDKINLRLSWPDNADIIDGEYDIGHLDFNGKNMPQLQLVPEPSLNPAAEVAIHEADLVVIAPGNLYASLVPALLVPGMRQALQETSAKVAYVCNLVTKPGQTDGYKVHDYARELERFAGGRVFDYVLYNNHRPTPDVLKKYIHAGELLVEACDMAFSEASYQAVGGSFIDQTAVIPTQEGDAIGHTRSFIRHDAHLVASQLTRIFTQSRQASN